MSITKAPQPTLVRNRKAETFIGRVGSSKQPSKMDVAVTVRVPPEVLAEIDERVKARRVRTPRHAWLLEAIYAKLDGEK